MSEKSRIESVIDEPAAIKSVTVGCGKCGAEHTYTCVTNNPDFYWTFVKESIRAWEDGHDCPVKE